MPGSGKVDLGRSPGGSLFRPGASKHLGIEGIYRTSQVMPKVTVYIPSHNYGRFLESAIESVLRQTYDSWELLLINDNSSDSTGSIMNRYRGDERVRVFETPGLGLHGVGNLALDESRGEYIIRLDGDDVFDENILVVLANYLDRNSDVALVFPDYYLMDEFGEVFGYERRQKLYSSNHMMDVPPHGAGTMIRKAVLQEIGGYRSDLKAQDGYYLWSKISGQHRGANVTVPLFYYRRHGNNLTNSPFHILEARRSIKRDSARAMLAAYSPCIAVIPCRKNYDFCENVWGRKIRDRTLLHHRLDVCVRCDFLTHIVVPSDTDQVERVLADYPDPRITFVPRHQRETIRSESIVTTLQRVVRSIDPELKGITVLSYVQNPVVSSETLEEAVCTLAMNDADCAFGVEEVHRPLYRRSPWGLQPINPPIGVSTDFDTVYAQTSTFLATKNKNLPHGSLTGPKVVNFVVSPADNFFIDSEEKLQIGGILLTMRHLFGHSA